MCNPERSLFDELDDVLRNGSPAKRVDMLRRGSDLFLSEADRFYDWLLRFWQAREVRARSA